MVFCSQCGVKCPEGRFCNACGATLQLDNTGPAPAPTSAQVMVEPGVPSIMVCPYCNQKAGQLLDKLVGEQHYHLNCFNCNECGKYLGSGGFYKDVRAPGKFVCDNCKPVAVKHQSGLGEPGYVIHRPVIRPTGDKICEQCGKQVFDSEKLPFGHKWYHVNCFKCSDCNVKLDASNFQTANEKPYCRACFTKHSGVNIKK